MLDSLESLKPKIHSIPGVNFVHERDAKEGAGWSEPDDEDDAGCFPELREPGRSYHIFFLVLPGEQFQYKTEMDPIEFNEEEDDENDISGDSVPGEGEIGLMVGVSLLAPIAMVAISYQEHFENGDIVEPDFRGPESEYPIHADLAADLGVLSTRVAKLLEAHGLRVLTADEARQNPPGLRPGDEITVSDMEGKITVFDAFFFHGTR